MEADEEMLSRILDCVPQPIWVVGPDGCILYTNPSAVSVLGYDDESELRGRSSHDTLHPLRPDGSRYPASECPMLTPARTGRALHGDSEWFMRRDGSFIPAYWWSSPVDLPHGRGVIYSFFDLTERRAYEKAARERDIAQVRATEFQAGQRRIVESIDAVHRRTARDLHDGAQQRLVSLLIALRLARQLLPEGPAEAMDLLDLSVGEAQGAIDELRSLASGIYPPVLTAKGLTAAVGELAARCPVPAAFAAESDQRLPAALESNAYFLIAESLTNAVKHARATSIDITVEIGDALEIVVRDDGVGGVPPSPVGSGLIGLRDRVGAFGGELDIVSPAGEGTVIAARIPLSQPEAAPGR
ncbi:PAS domain-containing sensor histidine kinase [Streptomyces griseofuscus]|uniref:PAS domain-containing sensor histidine kinase n=1 Tax=Streptomyces griseofuscus TaxID=146922 RepID=UPI00380BB181